LTSFADWPAFRFEVHDACSGLYVLLLVQKNQKDTDKGLHPLCRMVPWFSFITTVNWKAVPWCWALIGNLLKVVRIMGSGPIGEEQRWHQAHWKTREKPNLMQTVLYVGVSLLMRVWLLLNAAKIPPGQYTYNDNSRKGCIIFV
jgi:hypothetical protein